MTYELDEVLLNRGTLHDLPHIFRTQKEADFFTGYALVSGISIECYVKCKMPKNIRDYPHKLWAKIPDL